MWPLVWVTTEKGKAQCLLLPCLTVPNVVSKTLFLSPMSPPILALA
jgi:hypothetical protein